MTIQRIFCLCVCAVLACPCHARAPASTHPFTLTRTHTNGGGEAGTITGEEIEYLMLSRKEDMKKWKEAVEQVHGRGRGVACAHDQALLAGVRGVRGALRISFVRMCVASAGR